MLGTLGLTVGGIAWFFISQLNTAQGEIEKLQEAQSKLKETQSEVETAVADLQGDAELIAQRAQASLLRQLDAEGIPIATDWINMETPGGWTNGDAKCRVWHGWVELRGFYHFDRRIRGWTPPAQVALLPGPCRPSSIRHATIACHGIAPTESEAWLHQNMVCNVDFLPDGRVHIRTDLPAIHLRLEGARIWQGP